MFLESVAEIQMMQYIAQRDQSAEKIFHFPNIQNISKQKIILIDGTVNIRHRCWRNESWYLTFNFVVH